LGRKIAFGNVTPNLEGKTILVTGGTGSFGTAMVRRLLEDFKPRKVIVFSRDEQKHFQMQAQVDDPRVRFFVGDVRDRDRLRRAFDGVNIVFHAAAMKHVPLAEYNPIEAIRTNINGAENVIDAALDRGVERVVALSTDKAVSPVNLYGAISFAWRSCSSRQTVTAARTALHSCSYVMAMSLAAKAPSFRSSPNSVKKASLRSPIRA
jgi:FlaA1/EpsC-like NDP-sugar epimerase